MEETQQLCIQSAKTVVGKRNITKEYRDDPTQISPINFSENAIMTRKPHGAVLLPNEVADDTLHLPRALQRSGNMDNERTSRISVTSYTLIR